eukprot:6390879-Heterocapsa_arctica.AAC.1
MVDTAREDEANRLQDSHHELDLAEIEIAKQKKKDHVIMMRKVFTDRNDKIASRAWASGSSSS